MDWPTAFAVGLPSTGTIFIAATFYRSGISGRLADVERDYAELKVEITALKRDLEHERRRVREEEERVHHCRTVVERLAAALLDHMTPTEIERLRRMDEGNGVDR